MDKRTIYIIVAVVVVLAILGYALGWFGGSAPPPAATVPDSGTSRNGASANSGCASRACAADPSADSARAVATVRVKRNGRHEGRP